MKPLWTAQQLQDLVHVLARDSSRVVVTEHCMDRMHGRGVTLTEVMRCLQRGLILKDPVYDQEHKNFKFTMSEPKPRDIARVVVAVKPILGPGELIAITVWEI